METIDIKLIVTDVDGTLTDSGSYYDCNGNELKKFSTKDGVGFVAAKKAGIKIMILTGRECEATTRRMKELKADYVVQNQNNKKDFLIEFMRTNDLEKNNIAYIGDDVNDIPAMSVCGFKACPQDSSKEVLKYVDYVSPIEGGYGAVRDVIEYILTKNKIWNSIIEQCYNSSVAGK